MFVLKILNNTMDHMSQLNCLTHNKNTKCVNCSVRLIAFCGVLDDQSISKLDNISKDKKLSKGQHIFFQGDNVKSYFNIKQGSVKLYKLSKDGRKQIVGFLYPGDFMGMSADNVYAYSAETLEDSNICVFNKTVLENFFVKYPIVEGKILNLVNHELSVAQDQIFLLGKFSAKERLLQFFLNLSSQREKLGWVANPIRLSMSRADIANYLGITIETVSRTLTDLKINQIIKMVGTNDIYLNYDKEEISQNLI
jgi:CRP/FNR family transcriptional regulator, anaerobic regulatory protein